MAAEVSELCGPKHDPSSSDHYRGGSASGRVLLEGEREEIVRPRAYVRSPLMAPAVRSNWPPTGRPKTLSSYKLKLSKRLSQASVHGPSRKSSQTLRASNGPACHGCGRRLEANSLNNYAIILRSVSRVLSPDVSFSEKNSEA
jgi:hypothetical protein